MGWLNRSDWFARGHGSGEVRSREPGPACRRGPTPLSAPQSDSGIYRKIPLLVEELEHSDRCLGRVCAAYLPSGRARTDRGTTTPGATSSGTEKTPRPSQPLLALEMNNHSDENGDHDQPHDGITVSPFQFGHVLEIHAVDTSYESQRDEDRSDDCQDLHDVVHLVAYARQVRIQHS